MFARLSYHTLVKANSWREEVSVIPNTRVGQIIIEDAILPDLIGSGSFFYLPGLHKKTASYDAAW